MTLLRPCVALVALVALILSPLASAQSWPAKSVRIIVPYATGGASDITARIVAAKLTEAWGQQVLVENKPGAGTQIATEQVVKSAPDGYTLLLGPAAMSSRPWLYPNQPYDVIRDLEPVVLVNLVPSFLMVNASLPTKSLQELVAYLKANPGKVSYASAGNGTTLHLAGEWFKNVTGTNATHIPYKGSGPAIVDLASGQVQYMFENYAPAQPQITAGKIRILAMAGIKRSAVLPDVPTLGELGLPASEAGLWFSLMAPAGTPKDVVARINTEVNRILQSADIRERFKTMGIDAGGGTPDQLSRHLRAETEKWGKIIADNGIKAD